MPIYIFSYYLCTQFRGMGSSTELLILSFITKEKKK